MPSPKHRNRSSNTSQHSATGAAIRRGELKISDPIPFDTGLNTSSPSAGFDMSTFAAAPQQQDVTWPSRKVSPSEVQRLPRNTSIGHGEVTNLARASAGPSLVPSSLSTGPSKVSLAQKKNSGFRATLRRVFGSKRGRNSFAERKDFLQSVSTASTIALDVQYCSLPPASKQTIILRIRLIVAAGPRKFDIRHREADRSSSNAKTVPACRQRYTSQCTWLPSS